MLDLSNTPSQPLVAASILSADFGYMVDACRDVLGKGADLLHVDVMDGHFVPNLTMGADMIRGLRRHLPEVLLDVHLMVESPGDYIESFAEAGANHFTFHVEVCRPWNPTGHDAAELIEQIHAHHMTAGLAVNPPTDDQALPSTLGPYLDQIDLALIMSVNPGKSGQAFMPAVLSKAQWLRQQVADRLRVEMDGGLSPNTAPQAANAGVDMFVTASALFKADDQQAVIAALHGAKEQAGR